MTKNLVSHDNHVQELNQPIDLARAFVKSSVQIPAINSELSKKIKDKVRHSDQWLNNFSRVGDLLYYLRRFRAEKNDPVYLEIKSKGLLTFEDIVDEFEKKFSHWANDYLKISDFIVGHQYSAHDILILARNYDTRAGGMFVLEANDGEPAAVIIKATLSNGRYANEWVKHGEILKYYLKSISGNFGIHFKANNVILTRPDVPVVTFTRDSESAPFIYRGVFEYVKLVEEKEQGTKAFILRKSEKSSISAITSLTEIQNKLEKNIELAKNVRKMSD